MIYFVDILTAFKFKYLSIVFVFRNFSIGCSDSGIDDEDATKFIYNNGNNASTDNITAGVAA